jgi:hypothetical protein
MLHSLRQSALAAPHSGVTPLVLSRVARPLHPHLSRAGRRGIGSISATSMRLRTSLRSLPSISCRSDPEIWLSNTTIRPVIPSTAQGNHSAYRIGPDKVLNRRLLHSFCHTRAAGINPASSLGPLLSPPVGLPSALRPYSSKARISSISSSSNADNLQTRTTNPQRELALSSHKPRDFSTSPTPAMYTASFAFFEAIWEAGVTHCFVNLGSDHPSIIEAMVKGQQEKNGKFPRIITCPNEVCLLATIGWTPLAR